MMRRACAPLVRNASFKQAMQTLLTADWIDAHTVQAQVLIHRTVPADVWDGCIEHSVQSIVCKPAVAVLMGKRCCKTIVK